MADVPIFIPVPFQELSYVQYFSLEEQLHEMAAALKEQFPRHCFIKIQGTQPLLVPMVEYQLERRAELLRNGRHAAAHRGRREYAARAGTSASRYGDIRAISWHLGNKRRQCQRSGSSEAISRDFNRFEKILAD